MQEVYFGKPRDWLVGEMETRWDAPSELLHSHVPIPHEFLSPYQRFVLVS